MKKDYIDIWLDFYEKNKENILRNPKEKSNKTIIKTMLREWLENVKREYESIPKKDKIPFTLHSDRLLLQLLKQIIEEYEKVKNEILTKKLK